MYSPIMDTITFCYLISLVAHEKLDMCLINVVIADLYGWLDNDIYMKIPKGFNMPKKHITQNFRNFIQLNCKDLYVN